MILDLPTRCVLEGVDICICTEGYGAGERDLNGKPLRGECVIRDGDFSIGENRVP